jgi:hypothetical protein
VTAALVDRVTAFVVEHPGLTLTEIARGVQARDADIRDVLALEAFSASVRDENEYRSPQVYRLAAVGADGLGRRGRTTQCDLIARVLADGGWHTTAEIHRRCGFSRLNSRVAELRKRGMTIECRHVDGQHTGPNAFAYRLVVTPEAADALLGAVAAPDGESAASDVLAPDDPGTSDTQIEFGEAA